MPGNRLELYFCGEADYSVIALPSRIESASLKRQFNHEGYEEREEEQKYQSPCGQA